MEEQQLQLLLAGVAAAAALLSLAWIIYDSRGTDGAVGYRTAALTALVLSCSGLVFAAMPSLMEDATVTRTVIMWLGVCAGVASVVVLLVYLLRANPAAPRRAPAAGLHPAAAGAGAGGAHAAPAPRVVPARSALPDPPPTQPGWDNPGVGQLPPTQPGWAPVGPAPADIPPTQPSNQPGAFEGVGRAPETVDLREDDEPRTEVLRRPFPEGFVAWLACVAGPDAGRDIVLMGGDDIGHDKRCNICLTDPAVSGKHARVDYRDGHLVIRDLGSANRTFVNDEDVVTERVLADKDRLRLGTTELIYLEVRPDGPAAPGSSGPDAPVT